MADELKDILTLRIEKQDGSYVEQRLVAEGGLRLNDDLYDAFKNALLSVGFNQERIDEFFRDE